jgi:prepilin-type N-terminal cleavage/methylation domain-containing protein
MAVARDIGARVRRDDGFSLTELLVVLGIMGVVLAGAYSLALVSQKAADVSETQAAFANEVGTSLALAENYLQQNTALKTWTDYRLECTVDRDLDGFAEWVIIEAHANGELTLQVWNTDIGQNLTDLRIDYLMSENNVNVADGIPLFTYLKDDGTEVATFDARAGDTRSVIMDVRIDVNGYDLDDTRQVLFRNRS